jgi:hypothetical protein
MVKKPQEGIRTFLSLLCCFDVKEKFTRVLLSFERIQLRRLNLILTG